MATLATVLPPRHQTATLVYSNPQQLGANVGGPRLAVASPMATQRQGSSHTQTPKHRGHTPWNAFKPSNCKSNVSQSVRPIQISNARLPTTGINRVSAGNISIRGTVPLQTGTSSGVGTAVSASNLTVANLPAARIIQVQQQNPGGTTQVLSAGRITGNLMPIMMVPSTNAKINR